MKKLYNKGLLFFFLLCFLTFDSLTNFVNKIKSDPEIDQSLSIKYQNLLKDFQDLATQKEITLLDSKTSYAQVIIQDPLEFFEEVTISKGKEENITPFSAVLTNDGLIGIINKVNNHTSKVRLLTNTQTHLSVKVGDSYGILTTNDRKENWVKNLTKETKLEVGNEIYTSGLTEVPGGILIGVVEQIDEDDLGLTIAVKIKRNASIDNLNYVTILTKEQTE
jgi:rod shape-determining protein MreC